MTATRQPVVYRIYDANDRLIYVGATANPMGRVIGHQRASWWFALAARVSYEPHEHIESALAAEWTAIAEEAPAFNITHNGGRAEQVNARLTASDVQVCRDWLAAKDARSGGYLPMALRWIADTASPAA
jgi:excinuclease UvrABC nuclease subunit